jgi:anaphase-promoting complex subunit 1
VLIGIAASRFGTGDPLTSKTLCLHIPALLPSLHWDLEISPIVQSAAFAGLGLLYCRSGHRLMSELLLDELTRKPSSQTSECR